MTMADSPQRNLTNAFLSALSGSSAGPRRNPRIFNIGLDFGTAFTKCIVRDVDKRRAYPLMVQIGDHATFLVPSEVRVSNDILAAPMDSLPGGNPISYLKMALAAVAEPREKEAWLRNVKDTLPPQWREAAPSHIEALTAFFLSRVLRVANDFIREKVPDFGQIPGDHCSVNMAVPVGHAQHPGIENIFRKALHRAHAIAARADFKAIPLAEAVHTINAHPIPEATSNLCYLYPEVSANVQSYITSPAAKEGLHLFVDVGAGTVDLSAFIWFPHQSNSKHLSYLAAGVLPLGSSQIELRAAARCTATLELIRKFKETNLAPSAIRGAIYSAVFSARNQISNELQPQAAGLLKKVRSLIPTAQNSRNRNTQFYKAQLILGGGGVCDNPYQSAVVRAMEQVAITDPPVLPLPKPGDVEWPRGVQADQAFKRLSVAYGLSFLKATLADHRFPSEIRPVATSSPHSSRPHQRHAPTKEEM